MYFKKCLNNRLNTRCYQKWLYSSRIRILERNRNLNCSVSTAEAKFSFFMPKLNRISKTFAGETEPWGSILILMRNLSTLLMEVCEKPWKVLVPNLKDLGLRANVLQVRLTLTRIGTCIRNLCGLGSDNSFPYSHGRTFLKISYSCRIYFAFRSKLF